MNIQCEECKQYVHMNYHNGTICYHCEATIGRAKLLKAEVDLFRLRTICDRHFICPDCEKHITMERYLAGEITGCCRATLDRIKSR